MKQRNRIPSDRIITPAETNVAMACCRGWDDKEIANKLHVSRNTVTRHKQAIYDKAGIRHTVNALVVWFLTLNCGIDINDIERRIGALVMAMIFCAYTFGNNGDDIQAVRRARRGRRNREYEYCNEL